MLNQKGFYYNSLIQRKLQFWKNILIILQIFILTYYLVHVNNKIHCKKVQIYGNLALITL